MEKTMIEQSPEMLQRIEQDIASGSIDTTRRRAMPPTHLITGKTYHGLPDEYPYNLDGYVEDQAARARIMVYKGVSDGAEWRLKDGTRVEMWPSGVLLNADGTVCGRFVTAAWDEARAALESADCERTDNPEKDRNPSIQAT